MTHRIRQHQLEDLSRAKFNLVLPEHWVFRDKDKDYGIDVEVEIFDDKGKGTGLIFWVQLKATETKIESVAKKIDLKINSINYYKNFEIPVLIARYSAITDTFYFRWVHDIDLYRAKENAKTYRVSFSNDDIWGEGSPDRIEELLKKIRYVRSGKIKFPIPTSFEVKTDDVIGIPRGALLPSFRTALNKYSGFIDLRSESKETLLTARLSRDDFIIFLPAINGCGFHSIEDRDSDGFVEGLVVDTLLGCAISLAHLGQSEMAAQVALDKRVILELFNRKELLIHLLPYLLSTSYFCDVVDEISNLIDREEDNILETVTLSISIMGTHSKDEAKAARIEELLKKCVIKYQGLGDKRMLGISHYNLGNHYRGRRLNRLAAYNYLNARKHEIRYLDEPYYWTELGGVFFELEKFDCSAKLYNISLEKGASVSAMPLLADALMFAGKYQSALDVFSKYLDNNKEEHDEWHLKRVMLQDMIKSTGVREQARHKQEALALIDINKADEEGFGELLESVLELDLLCGSAWFNLGVDCNKVGKHEEATFNFIMCGLIQTWDIEAWVNASLGCLNKEIPLQYFALSIRTAYYFKGDEFLSKFYEDLNRHVDGKVATQVINQIDELLPKKRDRDGKVALRIEGDSGIFKNILE